MLSLFSLFELKDAENQFLLKERGKCSAFHEYCTYFKFHKVFLQRVPITPTSKFMFELKKKNILKLPYMK